MGRGAVLHVECRQASISQVSQQRILFLGFAVIFFFVRFASSLVRNKDCEMRVIFSDSKGSQPLWGCRTLLPWAELRSQWPLHSGVCSCALYVREGGCQNPDLLMLASSNLCCASVYVGWRWHCHSTALLTSLCFDFFSFLCPQCKRPTLADQKSCHREGSALWI